MINNRFKSQHTRAGKDPIDLHESIQLEVKTTETLNKSEALLNANQFGIACEKSHLNRNEGELISFII